MGAIAFGPEPGSELERRWSEVLRLEVDSLDETLGGNPVNLPFNQIEFEQQRSFQLVDELAGVDGGRPVDMTRRFSESSLGLVLTLDDQPVGHVAGSDSCGESVVRFVYEPEEQGYRRERKAGEIDTERLEGLEPDLDLLELLPAGEVEPGATWKVDPEALRRFFHAGGDLGFQPAEMVADMDGVPRELLAAGALGSLHELFGPAAELTGTVEASYAGEEADPAGGKLARIELELEIQAQADLGERFRALAGESASPTTHHFQLTGEVEGRLVVLWDLALRHLRSARFEGELGLAGHLVFPTRLFDNQAALEFVGDYELSGEAVVELAIE